MTYQLFKETLITELEGYFPPDTNITIHSIPRNNHTSADGLTILESGFNIAPTIYIQDYYLNFKNGTPFATVFKQLLDAYYRCRPTENIDPTFFKDFDNMQRHIVYKLIHYERNVELLQHIPHIPFLDLAIVFYCLVATDFSGTATILIRNEHLTLWNTDTETIYQIAQQNTPVLLSYEFETISSVLTNSLAELSFSEATDVQDILNLSACPIYILTNRYRFLGAACLLYDDLLQKLATPMNTDFIIIPSSIHEVLLLPVSTDIDCEEFNEMIHEVNTSQLIPQEILSDHVYHYTRETNQITY